MSRSHLCDRNSHQYFTVFAERRFGRETEKHLVKYALLKLQLPGPESRLPRNSSKFFTKV